MRQFQVRKLSDNLYASVIEVVTELPNGGTHVEVEKQDFFDTREEAIVQRNKYVNDFLNLKNYEQITSNKRPL